MIGLPPKIDGLKVIRFKSSSACCAYIFKPPSLFALNSTPAVPVNLNAWILLSYLMHSQNLALVLQGLDQKSDNSIPVLITYSVFSHSHHDALVD